MGAHAATYLQQCKLPKEKFVIKIPDEKRDYNATNGDGKESEREKNSAKT